MMKPKPFNTKFSDARGSAGSFRGRGGGRGAGDVARGGAGGGKGRGEGRGGAGGRGRGANKPKSINRMYPKTGREYDHDNRHQEPEIIELDSEPDSGSNVFQQAQQQFNTGSSQSQGGSQDLRSVLNKRRYAMLIYHVNIYVECLGILEWEPEVATI